MAGGTPLYKMKIRCAAWYSKRDSPIIVMSELHFVISESIEYILELYWFYLFWYYQNGSSEITLIQTHYWVYASLAIQTCCYMTCTSSMCLSKMRKILGYVLLLFRISLSLSLSLSLSRLQSIFVCDCCEYVSVC